MNAIGENFLEVIIKIEEDEIISEDQFTLFFYEFLSQLNFTASVLSALSVLSLAEKYDFSIVFIVIPFILHEIARIVLSGIYLHRRTLY